MLPLTSDDEHLLYGRAEEVKTVLAACAAGRVIVVSSAPCMGVTSFLEAGVTPALQREDCIVVAFRAWPGRYFAASLREKIADAVRLLSATDFSAGGDELGELLRRGSKRTGKRIALVLDQFDDYLRCHAGTDIAEAFDAELARAAALAGAAPLLFGLQNHALEAFGRLRQVIPNLLGSHIQLQPLRRDDVGQWVRREAERRRLELQSGVDLALLAGQTAASADGIHPFLFAVGLQRLMEAEIRMRSGAVRVSTIQEYGGPDKLILEALDLPLAELSSTHAGLFFRLCRILIAEDGRRQSATEQALTDYAGRLNRFVLTLLPVLIGKNILRSLEVRDGIRYEIARDGLVPIIRHWWDKREAVMVARRRATFRMRSLSMAVGTMILAYVAWLILTWKGR